MTLVLTLLVLWPSALIGVMLAAGFLLSRWPDQCDDLWHLPRAASSRLGFSR